MGSKIFIGALLCILAFYQANAVSRNKEYVIYKCINLCDTSVWSQSLDDSGLAELILEARCEVPGDTPRKTGISKCAWSLGWQNIGSGLGYEIEVRRHTDYIDDINGGRQLWLTVYRTEKQAKNIIVETSTDSNVDLIGGANTMSVRIIGNNVSVKLGSHTLYDILRFNIEESEWTNAYMKAYGCVSPNLFVVECINNTNDYNTGLDVGLLVQGEGFTNARTDGLWKYLDRENDNEYAKPGGFYELATVTDPETRITDIVYIGGADVANDRWLPGMRKGRLIPTTFINHYDLEWVSANMETLDYEMFAEISDDGAILTLSFPELKSKLRFKRIPLNK